MKCNKCGFKNNNEGKFCINCGNKLQNIENTREMDNNNNVKPDKKYSNSGKTAAIISCLSLIPILISIILVLQAFNDGSQSAGWFVIILFMLNIMCFLPIMVISNIVSIVSYFRDKKISVLNKFRKVMFVINWITLALIISVFCYLGIMFISSNNKSNLYKNNEEQYQDEEMADKEESKKKVCRATSITIPGNTEAEKAFNKLTGWTVSGWDYANNGTVSSSDLSNYDKISTILYNLGYFDNSIYDEIDEEGCILKEETLNNEIKKIFNDTSYEAPEFGGNDCLSLTFDYNYVQEAYLVTPGFGGCGASSGYAEKIYEEKESNNTLTFKTKVLMFGVDGISNLDSNNNFKEITSNIPDDVTYENVIDKYDSYANVYQWVFVKKNNTYVFDKIEKIK